MIEWDEASYQRKFGSSWTKLKDVTTGNTGWYRIISADRGVWIYEDPRTLDHKSKKIDRWEPMYEYVSSQFNNTGLLLRKHLKLYTVGIGPNNYNLLVYKPSDSRSEWYPSGDFESTWWRAMNPMYFFGKDGPTKECKQFALEEYGPITKRIFLGRSKVYYLTQLIGYRKGKDITTMNYHLQQEITDALREVL